MGILTKQGECQQYCAYPSWHEMTQNESHIGIAQGLPIHDKDKMKDE